MLLYLSIIISQYEKVLFVINIVVFVHQSNRPDCSLQLVIWLYYFLEKKPLCSKVNLAQASCHYYTAEESPASEVDILLLKSYSRVP